MKIVAVVPIKLDNERLPGKNIKRLGDKPLISYILASLQQAKYIDEIFVYCSDDAIQEYLLDGVKYLKRPKYLDDKTSNFTQIFSCFSNEISADIYVYTHATAPFITPGTINRCIESVMSKSYDSAFTVVKIQDFLWQNNRPVNFDAANIPRSQDLEPIYRETSGLYAFDTKVFTQYKRRVGITPDLVEVTFKESIDINNQEDFDLAEMMIHHSK